MNTLAEGVKAQNTERRGEKDHICSMEHFFIAADRLDGQLLALSTRGNHYRVLVWNIEEDSAQPVAVLGGVDEEISNLRVIRQGEELIVAGQGAKAIYIWKLNDPAGRTDACLMLNTNRQIYGYGVGISRNGSMYVAATCEKSLLFWNLDQPRQCIVEPHEELSQEEIVILNSGLTRNTYQLIGRSCEQEQEGKMIWLLEEKEPMTFALRWVIPNVKVLEGQEAVEDRMGILAAEIRPEGKVMALLTEKNTVLYDVREKRHIFTARHSAFESLDIRLTDDGQDLYLLEFSLWLGEYSSSNQVLTGYQVAMDGSLKGEKKVFEAEKHQAIQGCALIVRADRQEIYYNQHNNPVIYRAKWETGETLPFYCLEEGMMVISMKAE